MVRALLMALFVLIVLIGGMNVFAAEGEWTVIHELDIEHSSTAVGFLNDSFGITAGYAGEMHYTTDGGETWPVGVNQSMCRFGIDIVNEELAWTVGNGGNVRVSTDAGQTWQAVSNLGDNHVSSFISFIDDQTGWAASNKQMWSTSDGGETWDEITLPEGAADSVIAINLFAENEGYLLDAQANLYLTGDNGDTWETGALSLGEDRKMSVLTSPTMRFVDADTGMVVVRIKDGPGVVLRTADRGVTWTEEVLPFDVSSGAFFLSHDGRTLTFNNDGSVIVAQYKAADA
jgi:photosystem II stability/assembly factor-like uncharacterized protein